MTCHKKPNSLIKEKSPYLLQHAYNPVNWYPWSEEAFEKAIEEDKPIFLSIGYSTCHWCHVMERESFEDDEIAEILNEHYISIKVDREERSDVDHLYMSFCQAITGHGGWPLSLILTPDKKPFFAGTYFPKESRQGMPGFKNILNKVSELWLNDREGVVLAGEEVTQQVSGEILMGSPGEIPEEILDMAYEDLSKYYDNSYGGFGGVPKFPSPHNLFFLLRYGKTKQKSGDKEKASRALIMVEKTLISMFKGGVFDHIGYGFCRYSTDHKWLVPHFEKMLYDNALLAIAYLETYLATGKDFYLDVAEKIFSFILRDMTSHEGAFYSAIDADSEGKEGLFYLWASKEVKDILGNDLGRIYCQLYDIKEKGNFEGKNIPNLIDKDIDSLNEKTKQIVEYCRKKLYETRENRVHPFLDKKILTSWNSLMIAALAIGGRVAGKDKYTQAAEKAYLFLEKHLRREDGRLLVRYCDGEADYLAYLDDYAYLIWALIELYETTYKPVYLEKALNMTERMLSLFWDKKDGGFFMVGVDGEKLLAQSKEIYDGALPSGNSVAAMNMMRLGSITGNTELLEKAGEALKAFGNNIQSAPAGHTFMIQAYLYSVAPRREIVIVNEKSNGEASNMLKTLRKHFLPHSVNIYISPDTQDIKKVIPDLSNYKAINNAVTAYICQNYACQSPINDDKEFAQTIKDI